MKSFNSILQTQKRLISSARLCILLVSLILLICACAPALPGTPTPQNPATQPSVVATKIPAGFTIGFIYTGWKGDWGSTQAAHIGSLALADAFSGSIDILEKQNTPPGAAGQAMEKLIGEGARVIFSTDPKDEDITLQLAGRHPEVTFLQLDGTKLAPNLGTISGSIWQAVYLSGVAAGKMTKNNRLGYVAARTRPTMLLDINAFTLGVRSVNSAATVRVVFTESGCNSHEQQEAAFTLLDMGTDVVAQDQDCTQTIIEMCERNAVMSVGYNVDGATLAPTHWITGAVWNWGPLYTRIVTALQAGQWEAGPYNGRYRAGLKEGLVDLASFGTAVPVDVQTLVLARKQAIINGTFDPFEGPVKDQDGLVRIPAGIRPAIEDLEHINYLVEGVIGNLP